MSETSAIAASRGQGKKNTYMAGVGSFERRWLLVDATDRPLGRLAAQLAVVLQGKHRPIYTPHLDTGDFVIVTNAVKVGISGNKRQTRMLTRWTGYPGGLRQTPLGKLVEAKPEMALRLAVRRMLPKGRLGKAMIKKLKIYRGAEHPHGAQSPQPVKF